MKQEDYDLLLEFAKEGTITFTPKNLNWLETGGVGLCMSCCYGTSSLHADTDYDNKKEHSSTCIFAQTVLLLDKLGCNEKTGDE